MRPCLFFFLLLIALAGCRSEKKKCELDTGYHAVYQLSEKTIGISVANYERGKSKGFDSLFSVLEENYKVQYALFRDAAQPVNCFYYDTVGAFDLCSNKDISDEMKQLLNSPYYIYGTKGVVSCAIGDLVFGWDECVSGILAFTVTGFDVNKYGH